jgi:hypothetical protein
MVLLQSRLSCFFVVPDILLPGLLLVFAASIGVPSVDGGCTRAPSPKNASRSFFLALRVFFGALCSCSPVLGVDVIILCVRAGVMVISWLLRADLFLPSGFSLFGCVLWSSSDALPVRHIPALIASSLIMGKIGSADGPMDRAGDYERYPPGEISYRRPPHGWYY